MRLVACSHRRPVSYARSGNRLEQTRAGPGGLVAVLEPALEHYGGTWIFAPSTPEDRELAAAGRTDLGAGQVSFRIVDLPVNAHRDHYRVVSSRVLTPLFHYLLPLATAPAFTKRFVRAWEGYRAVNDAYGRAIHRGVTCATEAASAVLVEDVFLLLAGAAARARGATDVPIAYFHHIPWCEPDYFAVLPAPLRREILEALLAYDSVGFHCERWAHAFAACCDRFVPEAVRTGAVIEWRGRRTRIVSAPAAIDAEKVAAAADEPATHEWRIRLRELSDDRAAVVRVERADPQKNTVRGLEAFEAVLERRPEVKASTCLLAIMTPVREWIPDYRRYLARCKATAARINRRFGGSEDAGPVCLDLSLDPHTSDRNRALAALGLADVLVVNSVYDGLNIVALEGITAGRPSLVLSENAGVHELLGESAFSVNPFDVAGTGDAIERAIDEPPADRAARAEVMRSIATARTPADWVAARLEAAGA
jgi:trehalose 6-phosphate synthase